MAILRVAHEVARAAIPEPSRRNEAIASCLDWRQRTVGGVSLFSRGVGSIRRQERRRTPVALRRDFPMSEPPSFDERDDRTSHLRAYRAPARRRRPHSRVRARGRRPGLLGRAPNGRSFPRGGGCLSRPPRTRAPATGDREVGPTCLTTARRAGSTTGCHGSRSSRGLAPGGWRAAHGEGHTRVRKAPIEALRRRAGRMVDAQSSAGPVRAIQWSGSERLVIPSVRSKAQPDS